MRVGRFVKYTFQALCALCLLVWAADHFLGLQVPGLTRSGARIHRTPEQVRRVVRGLRPEPSEQGTNEQGCRYIDYVSEYRQTAVCLVMRGQTDEVVQVNVVFDLGVAAERGIPADVVAALSDEPVQRASVLSWIEQNKDTANATTSVGALTLELGRNALPNAEPATRVLQVY